MKPAPSQTAADAALQLDRENPYPGLHPFEEQDNSYFFGRSREREELFSLVARDILTVLFGRSGLGKTSLLNAGLFPYLREEFYLPIPIHLGFDPKQQDFIAQVKAAVSDELTSHHVDASPPLPEETLWEYFHREPLWNRRNQLLTPVLVFDQFEEIFTLGRNDERLPALLTELADLIENRIPLKVREQMATFENEEIPFDYTEPKARVILSLREDYLGYLDDLRATIPSIVRNSYRLLPLRGDQALEAVIEPARGLASEAVAEHIVRFVAGASLKDDGNDPSATGELQKLEIESSLLSLVCHELNERRLKKGLANITTDLMTEAGSQILTNFYQRSVKGVDPGIIKFIEEYLLTASGHRNSMAVDNALAQDGVTESALNQLINRRLLRREEHLGIPHVELIHDVLIKVILESRSKRRRKEEEQKRLRREKKLEQAHHIKQRNFWLIRVGALIAGFVLIGYWYQYDLSQELKARNETIEVQKRAIEAIVSILENRPVRSLLLARNAFLTASEPHPKAVEALQRAIQNTRQRFVYKHEAIAQEIAISRDGNLLAVAVKNNRIVLWDLQTNTPLHTLLHNQQVHAVAFDPAGARVVTASGKEALLWDTATGNRLGIKLAGHESIVESVQFSPDGRMIATTSRDSTARIWNAQTGEMIGEPYQHHNWVFDVAFSPDGETLATASLDKTAVIWDIQSGARKLVLDKHAARVNAVAFSPDATQIATAGGDKVIRIWNASTGELLHTLVGHSLQVREIAYSPDGHLASASEDKTIRVWDTRLGVELFTLHGHRGIVYAVAFDSTGQQLFSASADKSVRVWDAMHNGAVYSIDFSPDGNRLATASDDLGHTTRIWDMLSGMQLSLLKGVHQEPVYKLKFSPDGSRLATASWDKSAGIWDVTTGGLQHKLEGRHTSRLFDIDFSPDGAQLATAGSDKLAFLWSATGTKQPLLLDSDNRGFSHQRQVHGIAFSPVESDHHVATASWDGSVTIWDSTTGNKKRSLVVLSGHKIGGVNAVVFSPDGRLLATADTKKMVKLWSVDSGELIKTFRGHENYIHEISFSPDGKQLASGGGDKQAIIWDIASGKKLISLTHPDVVHDVTFSPDGKLLATACANGRYYLYPINNEDLIEAADRLIHQCRDEQGKPCQWYAPTD